MDNTTTEVVEEVPAVTEDTPIEEVLPIEQKEAAIASQTEDRSAYNCPDCAGEGLQDALTRCPKCGGTGKVN